MLALVHLIITRICDWGRCVVIGMTVQWLSGLGTAIDLIWLCGYRLLDWRLSFRLDLRSCICFRLWWELNLDKLLVLALIEATRGESLSENLGICDSVGHLLGPIVVHVALYPVLVVKI